MSGLRDMVDAYHASQHVPDGHYRCDVCGGVYKMVADWDGVAEAEAAGWTPEEMAAGGGVAVVCDSCWQLKPAELAARYRESGP